MKKPLNNDPKRRSFILFRPHHFLCTLGFQGKGYSDRFIQNFQDLKDHLEAPEGAETSLKVTLTRDAICEPCPNVHGSSCRTPAKIHALDQAHLTALSLKGDDILTWKEAKERIKQRISVEIFHDICKPCSWKELGICQKSLETLIKS